MLRYPLNLEKTESPDFFGACANETYGVEVSEATSAIDQREMTLATIWKPVTVGYIRWPLQRRHKVRWESAGAAPGSRLDC